LSALYLSTYLVLWALVLIQMVALAALYHHFGAIRLNSRQGRESQGPALDTRLNVRPEVLRTLDGSSIPVNDLGRPTFLVFVSTTCQPCVALRTHLGEFAGHADVLPVVLCAGPDQAATAEWAAPLVEQGVAVVHDQRGQIASKLGLSITPFLVAVDSVGFVRLKAIVNDMATLMKSVQVLKDASASLVARDELVANEKVEVSQA